MSDGSDKPKFAAGLAIAVSVITILAFFGIKSFDDLLNNKDSARSKACALAVAARNAQPRTFDSRELPANALKYADRLLTASEETDEPKLRGTLRESVYAHQEWAAALVAADDPNKMQLERLYASETSLARLHAAEEKWATLCKVPPPE
ncbi:hypothetical protein ACWEPC_53855 [Nonomuraea sp. NPDC004297]